MAATFVSIVNDAISESGSDLALYQTDGSDFTTNTDPQLNRFKTWVARSWKTIQQVAFDWHFLNNQAVVTINPGLMFYNLGDIQGVVGTSIDIYGSDDAVLFEDVPVGQVTDLTYTQYSDSLTKSFGYINLTCSGDNPLEGMTFKAGSDYFPLSNRLPLVTVDPDGTPVFYQQNAYVGDTLSFILRTAAEVLVGIYNSAGTLTALDPETGDTRGANSYTFSTGVAEILEAIDDDDYDLFIYNYPVPPVTDWEIPNTPPDNYCAHITTADPITTVTVSYGTSKAYLHSWKSFNFSEEVAPDDYTGELMKINPTTFQIIDHESESPSTIACLTHLPWSQFSHRYDWLTNPPATPNYISQDNTGRWRLYPHPDRPVTLRFDYNRTPQSLVEWDDVPKGLPEDFMELIMWLAVRMYGEYDEQPSVQRRAERYYKDMLQRLMMKYRPPFRLVPARLY